MITVDCQSIMPVWPMDLPYQPSRLLHYYKQGSLQPLSSDAASNGTRRYAELTDNEHFNTWNCGFVATAFMHHTQFIVDVDYVPVTPTEVGLFREMQIFVYALFE
jgi:hypothetical protein